MTAEEFGKAYDKGGFRATVNFLKSKGLDVSIAEEFSQAGWTHGFQKLGQLRDDSSLVAWINTIALRFWVVSWRKDKFLLLNPNKGYECVGGPAHVAEIDLDLVLKSALPRDRELFLQSIEGLTPGEIARKHPHTSSSTIRVRLFRAQQNTRNSMTDCTAQRRKKWSAVPKDPAM